MSNNINTGKTGEDLACNYLEKHGYIIIDRNWRFASKELDIVATKNNILVFVEVKTRNYNSSIEDCISDKKNNHLINGANHYINQNNIESEVRFDVILVLINNNKTEIKHYKEAITPNF